MNCKYTNDEIKAQVESRLLTLSEADPIKVELRDIQYQVQQVLQNPDVLGPTALASTPVHSETGEENLAEFKAEGLGRGDTADLVVECSYKNEHDEWETAFYLDLYGTEDKAGRFTINEIELNND